MGQRGKKLMVTNFIPDIGLNGIYEKTVVLDIGRIWYEMGMPFHNFIMLFIYMSDFVCVSLTE